MQFISFMAACIAFIFVFNQYPVLVTSALVFGGIALAWVYMTSRTKARTQLDEAQAFLHQQLERHSITLVKKLRQTIYEDDYGNHVFDKWHLERDYFIDNVLKKERPDILVLLNREWIANQTDQKALGLYIDQYNDGSDIDTLSPVDFEAHCAAILERSGWNAKITKASGDQGIDILANYQGVSAVFQCKKYSSPVGNAAVQEIIAGRVFERATVAAVISNASFTVSARQLAQTSDVHLLHHSELHSFAEKLGLG